MKKRRLRKRIMASVMAFLMVAALIPANYFGSVPVKAETGATVWFDISQVDIPEGTTEVVYSAETVFGDIPVLATSSKTVKVIDCTADGITDENGNAFTRKLALGGTGKTTERCVKITVPFTAEITVMALSSGAAGRKLKVVDENNAEVTTFIMEAKAEGAVVPENKVTVSAGTYYMYSAGSGIDIYDIDIQRVITMDISSVDIPEGTTEVVYSAETVLGDVSALATSSKTVKVIDCTADGITDENGNAFARKLALGGTGKITERCVKITVPFTAEIAVKALSSGAAGRKLKVVDENNAEVTTFIMEAKAEGAVVPENKVTVSAGTYYMYSTGSGIDIYDITVNRALSFDLSGIAEENLGNNISAEFAAGDFTVIPGSSTVKVATTEGITNDEGKAFTRKLSLGGSGSKTKRVIKFTLDFVTELDVYALSTGDAARTLKIENEAGTVVGQLTAIEKSNTVIPAQPIKLAPGTYYMYSAGSGIDVFDIRITPDAKPLTAWDEVATPVINNVTVDADGNFVVDFTANIDKSAGAEYLMVSMVSNGHEVASTKIVGKATSTVMIPYWSGDYTFTATAVRSGEAHKSSDPYEYKDYVLALKKPVFNMLESVGGGSVYVDWVNNEKADSYIVEYKEDGATDYTKVATTTDGHYTITGLTVGKTYDVKVTANCAAEGLTSVYNKSITVSADATHQWYAAITGSSQTSDITVSQADGTSANYKFDVQDSQANKTNISEAADITNTAGKVTINGTANGKISDDEDGIQYYFTRINPNKENFVLEATFKITDTSLTPDNQTGFGVWASDILGINNFGAGTYVHKYCNSVSCLYYSSKTDKPTLRNIEGYSSSDASNNDGADRVNGGQKFSSTASFAVGNTYTFKLEKTNDAFIGTFNGQELKYDNTALLSTQDDGSLCIGVALGRKVSVEITDIKFTTSESTGVSGGNKDTKITPNATVYSSETTGSTTYEYIYVPNCAGKLTVEGTDCVDKQVAANEVVRVNVTLKVGNNEVKSTFVPDAAETIASTTPIVKTTKVECKQYGKEGETIIVSPEGKADGLGTEESPLDIATAVKYAQPGQTLYLLDGTYKDWANIKRSVSGTADKMITMVAQTPGKVVFEGAGINVIGSYWHIYGIYVKDSTGVGIQVSGNYNVIEMCTVEHAANSGIQLSRSGSADNDAGINGKLWPTGNLIKNCESFDNCDAGRNDADGFAAKLTCGNDNKFYGCIAHHNIDDGWDLYAKSVSGEIGSVTIENCVAYNNGWLTTDDITAADYQFGEGNGFKLGGGYLKGGHVLNNSITFNNHGKGITSNSCPDCQIINCTSYNNSYPGSGAYSVGLNSKASAEKEWVVKGLISMANQDLTKLADTVPFALQSADNYIYDGAASYNNLGVKAVDEWFKSVDTKLVPARAANGSIDMQGLLELLDTAPADTGARLDVTSKAALSVQPQKTTVVSSINQGTDDENDKPNPDDGNDKPNPDDGNSKPDDNTGAATGDMTPNTAPFAGLLLISAMLMAGVYFYDRKRRALVRK